MTSKRALAYPAAWALTRLFIKVWRSHVQSETRNATHSLAGSGAIANGFDRPNRSPGELPGSRN